MSEEIKISLERRLNSLRLGDRVALDDSAIEELKTVSQGNLGIAEIYAGYAILDALQEQRATVTASDIEKVDSGEVVMLISTGRDPWDELAYIGTQVPNMTPEGIKLRRLTRQFDAARDVDAKTAISEGRLPQYALRDKIQYDAGGFTPQITIPFRLKPGREEVRAVAENLAQFIQCQIQEPQEVRDISHPHSGIQYFVQPIAKPGQDPLLIGPHYRVKEGFAYAKGVLGAVTIAREIQCKHPESTLEAYIQSILQNPSKS